MNITLTFVYISRLPPPFSDAIEVLQTFARVHMLDDSAAVWRNMMEHN